MNITFCPIQGEMNNLRVGSSYQDWVGALANGETVCLQRFHPAGQRTGFYPAPNFDRWSYILGTVRFGHYIQGQTGMVITDAGYNPFFTADGIANQHPDCMFPERIVPYYRQYFERLELFKGEIIWSDRPIYEPLYHGCYRRVYKVSARWPNFDRACCAFYRSKLPNYEVKATDGLIFHVFTKAYEAEVFDGAELLYEQRME